MARKWPKSKKCIISQKKIVHKYILGYILTLWIWLSLIMASQLRNLCTEVKTHQNCDLAKNMAKYAKNGQNYTPLFFIWAHYGTQKVWNDFGNIEFFLSGFTWNHPLTKPPWQFVSVKDGSRNLHLSLVKIGSVTAEIFLIWTNAARTNVACTIVTVTVGFCSRCS